MPTALAPPPRTGEAAPATSDPAGAPSQPSPVAAASPLAAGTLHALVGVLTGGTAAGLALVGALVVSGDPTLTLSVEGAALLALGFACANLAAILALAGGLRPPAVAIVLAIATGWTAGGLPLWVAAPATLLTALALAVDRGTPGGHRVRGRGPIAGFAAAATILLALSAATAHTHPLARPTTGGPTARTHRTPAADPGAPATGRNDEAPTRGADAAGPKPTPPAAAPPSGTDRGPKTAPPAAAPPAGAHGGGPPMTPTAPGADRTAAGAPGAAAPGPGHSGGAPGSAAGGRSEAEEFVRAYYAALDGRRFEAAWARLSPAVRTRFGGYAKWRAGYASTLASRPQDVRVNKAPDGSLTVRHVLVARDKSACGAPLERRFSVTWRLVGTPSRLTVASLAATALGPAVRAPSCP